MMQLFRYSVAAIALVAAVPALAQDVTITTAGGDYGAAIKKAMWEPAAAELGFTIHEETQSDGFAALKMQVTSGAVTTDVIHLGSPEGAQAAEQDLLEPLDYTIIDPKSLPPGAESKFCYPFTSYGTVMAWNTKAIGANPPANWADFWNVQKYPGKRALRANAQDLIEIALLSEGVTPANIYKELSAPGGLERAIGQIEKLKPNVAVWWTSGAQSAQILKDGEADLVVTWNGRAQSVKDDGGAADFKFQGSVIGTDCLAVPKGAHNREAAMKLIAAMTKPEREAKLTDYIAYGPVNPKAYEHGLISAEKMKLLATAPGNVDGSVFSNAEWWVKNGDAAQKAFDEMMSR
jgi:putative spermidine/putrescine transport system substrate-binding protein